MKKGRSEFALEYVQKMHAVFTSPEKFRLEAAPNLNLIHA